ncbi:hypothetical protein J6590_033561 [Homalodisca vitripennis]|nr:hypothetical protein J6590_033561 [Homalodisca vitripennis]
MCNPTMKGKPLTTSCVTDNVQESNERIPVHKVWSGKYFGWNEQQSSYNNLQVPSDKKVLEHNGNSDELFKVLHYPYHSCSIRIQQNERRKCEIGKPQMYVPECAAVCGRSSRLLPN